MFSFKSELSVKRGTEACYFLKLIGQMRHTAVMKCVCYLCEVHFIV